MDPQFWNSPRLPLFASWSMCTDEMLYLKMKRMILSPFYTGRVSIGFLMSSIFDTKCMWGLEKNTFKRHFADFVWMLLLGMMGTFIGTLCVPSYAFVGISLKFMILYYWTRRNPFFRVSLYMIPLKATLLPYALLFVHFLTTAESW